MAARDVCALRVTVRCQHLEQHRLQELVSQPLDAVRVRENGQLVVAVLPLRHLLVDRVDQPKLQPHGTGADRVAQPDLPRAAAAVVLQQPGTVA